MSDDRPPLNVENLSVALVQFEKMIRNWPTFIHDDIQLFRLQYIYTRGPGHRSKRYWVSRGTSLRRRRQWLKRHRAHLLATQTTIAYIEEITELTDDSIKAIIRFNNGSFVLPIMVCTEGSNS